MDKECWHPKFLEAKSVNSKRKIKTVKCGGCGTLLMTRKKDEFKMGGLPIATIEFRISDFDLEQADRLEKWENRFWTGFPDEYYSNEHMVLFKHGNTMRIAKKCLYDCEHSDFEMFAPVWTALLSQHEGDEMVQFHFLSGLSQPILTGVKDERR